MRYRPLWCYSIPAKNVCDLVEGETEQHDFGLETMRLVKRRDVKWVRGSARSWGGEGYGLYEYGGETHVCVPLYERDMTWVNPSRSDEVPDKTWMSSQLKLIEERGFGHSTNGLLKYANTPSTAETIARLLDAALHFLGFNRAVKLETHGSDGAPTGYMLLSKDGRRLEYTHPSPAGEGEKGEGEDEKDSPPKPTPKSEIKYEMVKQQKDGLEELVQAGREAKKKAPYMVKVDVGGVSPLGQAVWPDIEPIIEARINVLRAELIAKGVANLEIHIADKPKIELAGEHLHPCATEALAAVGRGEDLFLVGPPGSGKTYLAEQIARMLGYETAMISFNEQTMTSDIFGRYIVNDKGGMEWHDGPVPAAFRRGKTIIIMDEVDRANPNTVDGLNSALANRRCNLPQRRETLRCDDVVFVACANAYAADATNTSSNTLAASFYDRFWRMEVGYDKGLEERFLSFNMPLLTKLWAIRDAIAEHKLRRHVSTRFVIRAAKASKAGMKNDDVIKQLVIGWRKEEKDKLSSLLPKGA